MCLCLFLHLVSSCQCSLEMSQSIFLCKDSSFAKCHVLKLTLCVWYRCRSDRRQRKCSRANGVHSLQRILPGDQKRKMKQTLPLAFSFRNTTLCAALCTELRRPYFLDGGEHISEIFVEDTFGQGGLRYISKQETFFLLFVTLLQRAKEVAIVCLVLLSALLEIEKPVLPGTVNSEHLKLLANGLSLWFVSGNGSGL